jgi:arsenate reductase
MLEKELPQILFLCTGNSCRSQMAEALGRFKLGERYRFSSAGLVARGVDPIVPRVLAELGIDSSDLSSTRLDSLLQGAADPFDYVVTVCGHADEHCPRFAGTTTRLHMPFDDPPKLSEGIHDEAEILAIYRRVRDEIAGMIDQLPGLLSSASSAR